MGVVQGRGVQWGRERGLGLGGGGSRFRWGEGWAREGGVQVGGDQMGGVHVGVGCSGMGLFRWGGVVQGG